MSNSSIEAKVASLNNLQLIINRLSDTSSKVKGLYVTLISALLTVVLTYLVPKSGGGVELSVYLFSSIIFLLVYGCFFYIDVEYLKDERIMRAVYDSKARDLHTDERNPNFFDITGMFIEKKKSGKVNSKPSKRQVIFFTVPFILIELCLLVIWVK